MLFVQNMSFKRFNSDVSSGHVYARASRSELAGTFHESKTISFVIEIHIILISMFKITGTPNYQCTLMLIIQLI